MRNEIVTDGERDTSDSVWVENLFGLVAVALFPLSFIMVVAQDVGGWRGEPWDTIVLITGGVSGMALLAYLASGGFQTVVGKRVPGVQKLTIANLVGRVGIGFLCLALVGNFWESPPPEVDTARDVVGGGFAVCFIVYVILRYWRRHPGDTGR